MSHLLPNEVWGLVAARLSPQDVLNFPLVCREFSALAHERSFWIQFLEYHRETTPFACSVYAEFWRFDLDNLRHLVSHSARLKNNLSLPNPVYTSCKRISLCRAWNILITVPGTDFIVLRAQDGEGRISCWDMSTGQQLCSTCVQGTRPESVAYVTSCKYDEPGKCYVAVLFVNEETPGSETLIVLCLDYALPAPSLHIVLQHQYDTVVGFLSVAIGPDLIAFTRPSSGSYNEVVRRKISTGETRRATPRISPEIEVRTQMFLQGQDLYLCCHSKDGVRLYCWPDSQSDWHLVGHPWLLTNEEVLTEDNIAAMDIFTYPPLQRLVTIRPDTTERKQQVLVWKIPSVHSIADPDFQPSPSHRVLHGWETHFNVTSLVIATSDLTMFLLVVEIGDPTTLSLELVRFTYEPQFFTTTHTLQVPPDIDLNEIVDLIIDERKGTVLLIAEDGSIYQISYA